MSVNNDPPPKIDLTNLGKRDATILPDSKGKIEERVNFLGADGKAYAIAGKVLRNEDGTFKEKPLIHLSLRTRIIKIALPPNALDAKQPKYGYIEVNIRSMRKRLGTDKITTQAQLDKALGTAEAHQAKIKTHLDLAKKANAAFKDDPTGQDAKKNLMEATTQFHRALELMQDKKYPETDIEKVKFACDEIFVCTKELHKKVKAPDMNKPGMSAKDIRTLTATQQEDGGAFSVHPDLHEQVVVGMLLNDLKEQLDKIPSSVKALNPKFDEYYRELKDANKAFLPLIKNSGFVVRDKFDELAKENDEDNGGVVGIQQEEVDLLRHDQKEIFYQKKFDYEFPNHRHNWGAFSTEYSKNFDYLTDQQKREFTKQK